MAAQRSGWVLQSYGVVFLDGRVTPQEVLYIGDVWLLTERVKIECFGGLRFETDGKLVLVALGVRNIVNYYGAVVLRYGTC